jgi:hypothetical protein
MQCEKLRKLEFNPQREIRSNLRIVGPYRPFSKEKLKNEQPELYTLLVNRDIIKQV